MKKINGITIMLCIGKYGGFYIKRYKTGTMRICLGWVALSLCLYDFEMQMHGYISKLENQIEHLKPTTHE